MGQAKQRGTYEQRLVAAQERYALAMIERKRVEAEREAEWCRLQAEAKEQAAKDREARRQERIAAGLDPELPVQSGHSAFGRRRLAASRMAGITLKVTGRRVRRSRKREAIAGGPVDRRVGRQNVTTE